MKRRILFSIMTIAILLSVIGVSLAYFTGEASIRTNKFTAGTVLISAGKTIGTGSTVLTNWNPGDCNDLELYVLNEGSKAVYIRTKITKQWIPKIRILCIYTGQSVQLLALDWNSINPVTTMDGPLVTGIFYPSFPYNLSYIEGKFSSLTNQTWLQNSASYSLWCVDKNTTITVNRNYNVQVFDPFTNPDWYNEVPGQQNWTSIPWAKISYIVKKDYLSLGYTVNQIQDAIWHFTNNLTVSGAALAIVTDVNTNWQLPDTNVEITLGPGWVLGTDGYWYYTQSIPGTYSGATETMRRLIFSARVCLDGPSTGNIYQGQIFNLAAEFEAVQSSNSAIDTVWPDNPF